MRLVKKGIEVYYSGTSREERLITESLSMLHPEVQHIPSFRNHKWDGIVYFCNRRKRSFKVGLLDEVEQALNDNKIAYTKEGFEDYPLGEIQWSDWVNTEQRDYQRFAIIEFLKKGYGIIKIPTRGGKTVVSAEATNILVKQQNPEWMMAFFTDSSDLFYQAVEDYAKYFKVDPSEIGRIKESTFEPKQITVCMIQTVNSMRKNPTVSKTKTRKGVKYDKTVEEFKEELGRKRQRQRNINMFLADVDFAVIDEVHEYYSKERMKIIESMTSLSRLMSLSATPYKSLDEIGAKNIKSLTGGVVYEIEESTLKDKKVLAENKVLLLVHEITHNPMYDMMTYSELEREVIMMSETRNAVISTVINICDDLKLKTLAMFRSKEHGYLMDELLDKIFLSGDADDETRKYTKEWFLEGEGKVLLASEIWKKGITLPEVEVFINGSGGKEESLILQKRGRVLGATDSKKKALAIDFIDNYDKYFNEHSLHRIEAYTKVVGEDNIDVIDASEPEFPELLRIYLEEWFEK